MTAWDASPVLCPRLPTREARIKKFGHAYHSASAFFQVALSKSLAQTKHFTDKERQEYLALKKWREDRVETIARDIQSRPEFLALLVSDEEEEMTPEQADAYLNEALKHHAI